MGEPLRPHRWLLAVVRLLVPRALRDEWTREWDAELDHRESRLRHLRRPTLRDRARLLRHAAGAVWDALWLRTSRWQTVRNVLRHGRVSLPVVFSLAAAMAATIGAAGLYDALLYGHPAFAIQTASSRCTSTCPRGSGTR